MSWFRRQENTVERVEGKGVIIGYPSGDFVSILDNDSRFRYCTDSLAKARVALDCLSKQSKAVAPKDILSLSPIRELELWEITDQLPELGDLEYEIEALPEKVSGSLLLSFDDIRIGCVNLNGMPIFIYIKDERQQESCRVKINPLGPLIYAFWDSIEEECVDPNESNLDLSYYIEIKNKGQLQ